MSALVVKRHRVLVVGLDGATFDLLDPWIEAGHLPTLAGLVRRGASARLQTDFPHATMPSWPSFATGMNPGKHGVFNWLELGGDRRFRVTNSTSVRSAALWDVLGAAGRRVCSVFIPVTYPPRPVNGCMVTGMLTPADTANYTYPAELKEEIEAAAGRPHFMPPEVYSEGNEEAFIASLHETIERKYQVIRYLLVEKDWDVFLCHFNESDVAHHGLWKFMDATHPDYTPEGGARFGAAILGVYRDLDSRLRELLSLCDASTHVIVVSDHGAGPMLYHSHLNNWLHRMGYLRLKRTPATLAKHVLFRLGATPRNVYHLGMKLGLAKLRRRLNPNGSGSSILRRFFLSFRDVDWSRTRAFATGGVGQVFINVAGRFEDGPVRLGAEYEDLRNELIAGLRSLRLPSGEPYADWVCRREDLFHGPRLALLPDIMFISKGMAVVDSGEMEFFSNRFIDRVGGVSASHRPEGILAIAGPGVAAGRLEGVRLQDVTATILHLAGVPIPADLDGVLIAGALDGEGAAPVRAAASEGIEPAAEAYEMTAEEEQQVVARLRALGYV